MIDELVAQGHVRAGRSCCGSQEVWQHDTKIGRSSLHLDRHWMSDLAQDLRHAFRGMRGMPDLRRSRSSSPLGNRSQLHGLQRVNALLLRPLPFRDPDGWYGSPTATTGRPPKPNTLGPAELNRSFSDLAGWSGYYFPGDSELTGAGEPERLTSVPVTGNLFALLGVEPAIGRSFTAGECQGSYSAPRPRC